MLASLCDVIGTFSRSQMWPRALPTFRSLFFGMLTLNFRVIISKTRESKAESSKMDNAHAKL